MWALSSRCCLEEFARLGFLVVELGTVSKNMLDVMFGNIVT